MGNKYVLNNESNELSSLANDIRTLAKESTGKKSPRGQSRSKTVAAQPPSTWKLALLGLITFLVVAGAILVVSRSFSTSKTERQFRAVPNVIGQKVDVAKSVITRTGLRPVVKYDSTSKSPSGTVIALDPPAGTNLKTGDDLTVKVAGKPPESNRASSGNPDENETSAQPDNAAVPDDAQPEPAKNTAESAVISIPSNGEPAKVAVPDVEGMVSDKATSLIENAGLQPVIAYGQNPNQPSGVVLSSEPEPGAQTNQGTTVRLTVNKVAGSSTTADASLVDIPTYAGMDSRQAVQDLRNRGLTVTWKYLDTRLQPSGKVVETNPPAGSKLPPRASITVTIAR